MPDRNAMTALQDDDPSKPYIGMGRNQKKLAAKMREKKPEYQGSALDDYFGGIFGAEAGGSVLDPNRAARVQANDIGQKLGIGLDIIDAPKALLGLAAGGTIKALGKQALRGGDDALAGSWRRNLRELGRTWRGEDAASNVASVTDNLKKIGRKWEKQDASLVERSSPGLAGEGLEPDIVRSMMGTEKYKRAGGIPRRDVASAYAKRATLRSEKPSLPKPAAKMTDEDWLAFGQQHGVDMSQTPMQGLGISDLSTRRELQIPGGLEGTFTIPDLFRMKSQPFDPNVLPQDTHNALMAKFMRTYQRPGGMTDPVDRFNALNFALLSPNAPLTQNEFLMQRLRLRTPEELDALARMTPEEVEAAEKGTGAAARGGMGVKGTADLGNQVRLAQLLRDNPALFEPGEGETMLDVAQRVMNQVPGLGPKTSSLGVPWLDLEHANTSAVDLHMIRNSMDRLLTDPEVGQDFTERIAGLVGMPGATPQAILARKAADKEGFGADLEKAAISIVGGAGPGGKYRYATGELNPNLPDKLKPDQLAYEPESFQDFNPFYKKVVQYVDESRAAEYGGAKQASGWGHEDAARLPLFPEQWRLWDRYRRRVEPHEFAHPDWRKLPKQSFGEMQDALSAHKQMGYTSGGKDRFDEFGNEIPTRLSGVEKPWNELYYGRATPEMLGVTALGAGGAAAAANDEDVQAWLKRLTEQMRGGQQPQR